MTPRQYSVLLVALFINKKLNTAAQQTSWITFASFIKRTKNNKGI